MKSTKANKGITLVALIITIVVLLILATVSINSIQQDGGLIQKANGVVDKWNQAQKDEEVIMNSYLDYLGGGSETTCSHVWINNNYSQVNNKCTICGFECTHSWVSGAWGEYGGNTHARTQHCSVCRVCYDEFGDCVNFVDGKCTVCGLQCEHVTPWSRNSTFVNGTCSLCGGGCTAPHSWSNGVCTICGLACTHPSSWEERVSLDDRYESATVYCTTCEAEIVGGTPVHEYDTSGVCGNCGYHCTHFEAYDLRFKQV